WATLLSSEMTQPGASCSVRGGLSWRGSWGLCLIRDRQAFTHRTPAPQTGRAQLWTRLPRLPRRTGDRPTRALRCA
ncbi:hypothetical protein IWW51_005458, partial [Coemansia sp. RSA 2702]